MSSLIPPTPQSKWNRQWLLQEEKYSGGSESYGKQWTTGDVVGVFLDLIDHTISKLGPTHYTGCFFYFTIHRQYRSERHWNGSLIDSKLIALCFYNCSSCTMAHVIHTQILHLIKIIIINPLIKNLQEISAMMNLTWNHFLSTSIVISFLNLASFPIQNWKYPI